MLLSVNDEKLYYLLTLSFSILHNVQLSQLSWRHCPFNALWKLFYEVILIISHSILNTSSSSIFLLNCLEIYSTKCESIGPKKQPKCNRM